MPSPSEDVKAKALRAHGALNPHPERIEDETFHAHEFFDPRDRVQVKYEMVRRRKVEGKPVTQITQAFGTSRQAFYGTQAAFEVGGISGLIGRPRGPRRAHKCTDELLDFVEAWRERKTSDNKETLTQAIKRRFKITVHPRSLDRALRQRKKKRKSARKKKL